MEWTRWVAPKVALVALAVLALAAPAVIAQSASPVATVQKTTTLDAFGNTVVTERTFFNGQLVKQEVTVTSRGGQLVSKTETVFNGAGKPLAREVVTVNAGTVTKTEQKFANGQVVKQEVVVTNAAGQVVSKTETVFTAAGQVVQREIVTVIAGTVTKTEQKFVNGQLVREEVVTVNNGQQVKVEREFKVVNGVLKEIKEERKVEKKVEVQRIEGVDPDHHGTSGPSGGNRGKDNNGAQAAEAEHQSGDGDHSGGGDGGHRSGR